MVETIAWADPFLARATTGASGVATTPLHDAFERVGSTLTTAPDAPARAMTGA